MEENRYSEYDFFEENNQQDFKEEVKQWVRSRKGEILQLCKARNLECESTSPYGMLAKLMGINISSINNWMSLKARKMIPENRVEEIRRIMREVAGLVEAGQSSDTKTPAEDDRSAFVQQLKERLNYEAIGRFYMEAEKAGMSLDSYLQSLLK